LTGDIVSGQTTNGEPWQPSHSELILISTKNRVVEIKTVGISGCISRKILDYDLLILATGSSAEGYTLQKRQRSTKTTEDNLATSKVE